MFPEEVIEEYSKELEELGISRDECFTTLEQINNIIAFCENLRKEKIFENRLKNIEDSILEIKQKLSRLKME